MFEMPHLPTGYEAFPVWHRPRSNTSYELNRVYDPRGRLCRDLSFWWLIPTNQGEQPRTRWISYEECRRLHGNRGLSFAYFASAVVPIDELERWVGHTARRAERKRRRRGAARAWHPA